MAVDTKNCWNFKCHTAKTLQLLTTDDFVKLLETCKQLRMDAIPRCATFKWFVCLNSTFVMDGSIIILV